MPTIIELGQKTKAKYPEYKDMSDLEVGQRVKAKYPKEYADFTEVETVQPKKSFLEKTAGVLDTIFGGGKIGEAIGTQIAKSRATPEEKQYIEGPSASQVLGDVGRVALNFAPVGTASKALGVAGKAVGLGRLAKPVANIATGAGVGYGADVTNKLAEGAENPFTPSLGTGIGAGIASVPYVGKALGKLGSEALGVSTGTGAGTIQEFTSAITKGGEGAKVAREALRGNFNAQDVVDEAKNAFGTIIKNRSDGYSTQLSKLKTKTNVIDHTPIIQKFNKQLEDFGVFANADGTPNFSRAPGLGRYEKDLTALSKTLAEWGSREGDNTIAGVDKLKQVIDDFRIGSADSKKFDSFVTNLRGEAKNIIRKDLTKSKDLKTLLTYDNMLSNYEKSTKDIRDIQKALSLGDKASVDTAFRKLSTVLRTNNEVRKQAVDELNELTGGTLLPKIAGQQLSEVLPRGLARTLGGVGVGAGAISGVGILPMLKLAMVSSPRLVGEMLNLLGIVGNKANIVKDAILKTTIQAPGDYLLQKSTTDQIIKNAPKNSIGKSIPKSKPKVKQGLKNKQGGFISPKVLGAGLGASGLALANTSSKTEYKAPKEETKISPKKLGETLKTLESSGGTNKSNADKGEKKWLVGLTDVAIKELQRVGRLDKNFDKNNEAQVLDAGAEYFKLMQERNPELTPAEVYVDKYWTQWKNMPNPQQRRQRKIEEFNNLIYNT